MVQRYGRDVQISGEKRIAKRRQMRYWSTFEYVTEAIMFMFRFRTRIWEVLYLKYLKFEFKIEFNCMKLYNK